MGDQNGLLTSATVAFEKADDGSLSLRTAAQALIISTGTVTRPLNTSAYATGQVVGGVITLPDVVHESGGSGEVLSVSVATNEVADAANAGLYLMLLTAPPASPPADGDLYGTAWLDRTKRVGTLGVGPGIEGGGSPDAIFADAVASGFLFKCAPDSRALYALLVLSSATYTPASGQVFEVTVRVRPD